MSINSSQGLRAAEMNTNSWNENGNEQKIQPEHISPSATVQLPSTALSMHSSSNKKTVKYMECLKNHAAATGGHATDGCGEFMPGGEESTVEVFKCSACNCHRNFHKQVIEGECPSQCYRPLVLDNAKKPLASANHHHKGFLLSALISSNSKVGQNQETLSSKRLDLRTSEFDEQEEGVDLEAERPDQVRKKRYRTKFSQEQKEKMWSFAEKVGWKIQRLDDSAVHHFCQEIGIKRRVLKVWMHNNKHNLAKKSSSPS